MGLGLVTRFCVINAKLTAMEIVTIEVIDGIIALVLACEFAESHA